MWCSFHPFLNSGIKIIVHQYWFSFQCIMYQYYQFLDRTLDTIFPKFITYMIETGGLPLSEEGFRNRNGFSVKASHFVRVNICLLYTSLSFCLMVLHG